jgi:HPt (histidine-containing phosphotransfer) domain-containing protein
VEAPAPGRDGVEERVRVEPDHSTALDAETLLVLRADLGDEKLTELLGRFVERLDSRFADMRASLAGSRDEELRRQAHALKGSAATYGARRLATLCSDLEKEGASPRAPSLLDDIAAELSAVRDSTPGRLGQTA